MPNKMLIDASHPEETRVVVVRGNRVEEFDFEAANRRQLRGNIYLAKVTRVEPSLQACFVDYGGNRHGFLAFSEIHPDYYQIPVADRQALIEEEERAAREADARRAARHQARHARRDQTISEPAQEDGNGAPASGEAPHDDEHASQIEEVPHDDEAPEEIGAHGENGNDGHKDAEHGEPEHAAHAHDAHDAHEHSHEPYNEAAGSESGGAAEASEAMSESESSVSIENGRLVGIIDESDILGRVEGDYESRWDRFNSPVSVAMTHELHTLQASQTLDALLPVFDRNEVAIIFDGDEFIGLVTRIDLINHLRRNSQ